MEESGHYYTVYFTSLAVGFKQNVAYRQAVLAQMPDEVAWLDAANLHEKYCFGKQEVDFGGTSRKVPNDWRYIVEIALHSLTGGSSSAQRISTRNMLLRRRADSLEFGLLLHRLGDTYAHSVMGEEQNMYSVKMDSVCSNPMQIGHLRHSHDPDFPFLRQDLFLSYLRDLHGVLQSKAENENNVSLSDIDSLTDSRAIRLSYDELAGVFRNIFSHNVRACIDGGLSKSFTVQMFINDIRRACSRNLNIEMVSYRPENQEAMSLATFLSQHPEIASLVGRTQLENAISNISKSGGT